MCSGGAAHDAPIAKGRGPGPAALSSPAGECAAWVASPAPPRMWGGTRHDGRTIGPQARDPRRGLLARQKRRAGAGAASGLHQSLRNRKGACNKPRYGITCVLASSGDLGTRALSCPANRVAAARSASATAAGADETAAPNLGHFFSM